MKRNTFMKRLAVTALAATMTVGMAVPTFAQTNVGPTEQTSVSGYDADKAQDYEKKVHDALNSIDTVVEKTNSTTYYFTYVNADDAKHETQRYPETTSEAQALSANTAYVLSDKYTDVSPVQTIKADGYVVNEDLQEAIASACGVETDDVSNLSADAKTVKGVVIEDGRPVYFATENAKAAVKKLNDYAVEIASDLTTRVDTSNVDDYNDTTLTYPVTDDTTSENIRDYVTAALAARSITDATVDNSTKLASTLKDGDPRTGKIVLKDAAGNKSTVDAKFSLSETASVKKADDLWNAAFGDIEKNGLKDFDTVDDNNVATGSDKDAAQAYLQKLVNNAVKKYANTSATVEVGNYVPATHGKDGKVAVTLRVTNTIGSNETSDFKVGMINVKHSDNQKLKEAVDATTDAAGKIDTSKYQTANTVSALPERNNDSNYKNKAYTYNAGKAGTRSVEGIVDKIIANALDTKVTKDSKVSSDGWNDKNTSFKITKYTPATNSTEGTAHVVVTYTIANDYDSSADPDDDTLSSEVAFDLTFSKLKEKKTTFIDLGEKRYMKRFAENKDNPTEDATITLNVDTNGNDELEYTSSNPDVAVVEEKDGKVVVTAKGLGTATITATNKNNSAVTDSVDVTVKSNDNYKFTDVQDPDKYYFSPIYSAVNADITSGTTDTTFSPNAEVTRAQFITWLYKKAGAPAVQVTDKFSDVSSNAFYAKAVSWAVSKGITSGTTATTFSPNKAITRAQAVTFLYKATTKTDDFGYTSQNFTDVAKTAYYYDAVQWAAYRGVTGGKTATTFGPNDTCTRGQAITFLMKAPLR